MVAGGSPTPVTAVDMRLIREFWDQAHQDRHDCEIRTMEASDGALLQILIEGEAGRSYRGRDFEEVLQAVRVDFESVGRLLLVNRFRQDAFVSPMSRQMSNGLSCYLVEPRKAVDASMLVKCLELADERHVVIEAEAREFIAHWQSQPPWDVRFPWLGWLKSGRG